MPENWLLPTITSNYATGVIQAINNKFIDAITLFRGGIGSNLPVNAIRYNGDIDGTFQRWNGTDWIDMRIAVEGGGTGSANAAGARTNLGLGTMSTQNSNLVNITGGTISVSSITSGYLASDKLVSADGSLISNIDASKIALGIINPNRLANGTPNSTVFLRGDSIWASPAGTLPSGLVAMFDVDCPVGWTRMVAWDGKFPRPHYIAGGVGGSEIHNHDGSGFTVASHSHGAGSYATPSHNHGGSTGLISIGFGITISGTTGSGGGHDHAFSDSFSGTTGGESNGQMNCDAGASGNMSRSQHTHDFSGSVSGRTDSAANHSHSFSGSGSGSGTAYGSISTQGTMGITGTSAAAAPGISGNTGMAVHYPPYINVVFCKKD